MVWNLTNAFPIKVARADFKAGACQVAIESSEIAYEGIAMENPA